MVLSSIKIDEVEHCDWQDVRLSEIWNRMRSERKKVDQANSSLLKYKNFSKRVLEAWPQAMRP